MTVVGLAAYIFPSSSIATSAGANQLVRAHAQGAITASHLILDSVFYTLADVDVGDFGGGPVWYSWPLRTQCGGLECGRLFLGMFGSGGRGVFLKLSLCQASAEERERGGDWDDV